MPTIVRNVLFCFDGQSCERSVLHSCTRPLPFSSSLFCPLRGTLFTAAPSPHVGNLHFISWPLHHVRVCRTLVHGNRIAKLNAIRIYKGLTFAGKLGFGIFSLTGHSRSDLLQSFTALFGRESAIKEKEIKNRPYRSVCKWVTRSRDHAVPRLYSARWNIVEPEFVTFIYTSLVMPLEDKTFTTWTQLLTKLLAGHFKYALI